MATSRARVFEVTGATLGGSWKTPLAMAIAREIAIVGAPVTVLCHGYRSQKTLARQVISTSPIFEVGDEALLVARRLDQPRSEGSNDVEVVVAVSRRDRVDAVVSALERGRYVVVDGRVRGLPDDVERCSLLALDAEAPWGSNACPPAGDLRAPIDTLCTCASRLVIVRDELGPEVSRAPGFTGDTNVATAVVRLSLEPPERLVGRAVCVVTACARPDRFVRSLGRRGVKVERHVVLPDHGGPSALALLADELVGVPTNLPLVLTEKCSISLESGLRGRDVEVIRLDLFEDDVSRLMTPFLRGVSLV